MLDRETKNEIRAQIDKTVMERNYNAVVAYIRPHIRIARSAHDGDFAVELLHRMISVVDQKVREERYEKEVET